MNNWDQLSPESRLWMYGSKRALSADEQHSINQLLANFCAEWSAHGSKLDCGFSILYNQIIILGVDEKSAEASGCSIDTSVQIFRELDTKYDLDLFNRLRTYHLENGALSAFHANEVKAKLENNQLHPNSIFLDMLVPNKGLIGEITKPLKATWLSKYV
ncbi:MAG: hypothetical protein KC517_03605 [Bacteroidetes bacterium]|jgi:hypothetical protein|nr:hypothetical protein [Bacteroidota bacterium]